MVAGRGVVARTNDHRAERRHSKGSQMSRRIQVLWAAALYVTFAAVAVGHISAGDWGYLFVVTTLAVAASAAFTMVLRIRRGQPVPAEATAEAT
jgi:cobalamin synthase